MAQGCHEIRDRASVDPRIDGGHLCESQIRGVAGDDGEVVRKRCGGIESVNDRKRNPFCLGAGSQATREAEKEFGESPLEELFLRLPQSTAAGFWLSARGSGTFAQGARQSDDRTLIVTSVRE
jgi:hypothetical protein